MMNQSEILEYLERECATAYRNMELTKLQCNGNENDILVVKAVQAYDTLMEALCDISGINYCYNPNLRQLEPSTDYDGPYDDGESGF